MIQITNAEKQARHRKKEHLKRCADRIFNNWVCSPLRFRQCRRTEEEVRHLLSEAVKLPADWQEADYKFAEKKLGQCELDLRSSVDQIANDVNGDWASNIDKFKQTPDPAKFFADHKTAVENAGALASHIISALGLSNCNDADQAAALMEALRFVGRSLVSNREIHCSQATAQCLANIGPQYDRPDWFAEKLAEAISQNIDKKLAHEVGHHLSKL